MSTDAKQPSRFRRFLRIVWRELNVRHIFLYAAAISFNIFTTAFPFILVLFSVFGYVLSSEAAYGQVSSFVRALLPVLNRFSANEVLTQENVNSVLLSFIENRTRFVGFSAILFIFLVSGLYATLRVILNHLWDIKSWRHILHARVRDLVLVGMMGTLLLMLAILTTAAGLITQYSINLFDWQVISLGGLVRTIAVVFPLLVIMLVAFLLYRLLPDDRPPVKVALVSTLSFTVLWEIAKYVFGYYIASAFPRFNAFYGTYAVLVSVAIWVYYSSLIFVISACIGHAYRLVTYPVEPLRDGRLVRRTFLSGFHFPRIHRPKRETDAGRRPEIEGPPAPAPSDPP